MARNRQRAKQRQAERRAARLAERRGSDGGATKRSARPGAAAPPEPAVPGDAGKPPPSAGGPLFDAELAAGAPAEELGRSDQAVEAEPDLEPDPALEREAEALEREAESRDGGDAEAEPRDGRARAPRAERARRPDEREDRDRSRLVQFLIAVWAELKRVQWPNRQALTTLTGVVLGFVLIAGGYLGLLDAIFSRLIQAIL